MRQIQKNPEPSELTEWKAQYRGDPNFGYDLMRGSPDVCDEVERSLLREQGNLDAYTEQRIWRDTSHVEHLKPQSRCTPLEEVDYRSNLVACYPEPNHGARLPYGAHEKDNWPGAEEEYLFVSPLDENCEHRFTYTLSGDIEPSNEDDQAASETINQLKLDCLELRRYRRGAIDGVLGEDNSLSYRDARVRLRNLEGEDGSERTPFCTTVKQALEKHIQRLEYIKQSNQG